MKKYQIWSVHTEASAVKHSGVCRRVTEGFTDTGEQEPHFPSMSVQAMKQNDSLFFFF